MARSKTKETKAEAIKRDSRYLRGTIADTLGGGATHFVDADVQLLKPHGIYQQDNRDTRTDRKRAGLEADYSFMIRVGIPGGVLTADQYLLLDRLAEQHGNRSLRLTTRQSVQFHGVRKPNLRDLLADVNQELMTTFGACGDVHRNVMACPAPAHNAADAAIRAIVQSIAAELRPASRAYHEIWLDGEKLFSTDAEEPFYGDQYLPRKFKTGVAFDTHNCVDIFSYDCGLIAIVRAGRLLGFNLVVGGGMGMTHNAAHTVARLADPLAFVPPEQVAEVVRAVAAVFRDHGNRGDRKQARLKYLIADWGIDVFRDAIAKRLRFEWQPYRRLPRIPHDDHLGRHRQADGRWFLGVHVANGRVSDKSDAQLRSGLRTVIERCRPAVHLTPEQNLLLVGLTDEQLDATEQILADHGVAPASGLTGVRRLALACPALPTCGLAITESERVMPQVLERFEAELAALGLQNEPLALRMTGCPNGCARPYTADIAFVGRKPGERYNVYVGGGVQADRVADLFVEDATIDEAVAGLRPLLQAWAEQRRDREPFGEFYQRLAGNETPKRQVTGAETPSQGRLSLNVLS